MTDKPVTDTAVPRDPSADAEWASLAASLATDKGPRSAPSQAAAEPPRGVQRAVLSSSVALVFAFIAVTVAGMLWWQYRQFYVSLDETDTAAADALARVRAEQRALQDGLQNVNDDVDALRERGASLGERLDALPGRFAALEQRLDTVQGGSFDARGTLLRAEAEYYLTVANTELVLVGDFESAVTALELADSRLAEIGNPDLAPVREAIAGELLALKSLRLPDIEGIVFSLGRLASRADELPLRADLPLTLSADSDAELDAEPGLARLWLAVKRTLLDVVRVERRDEPVPQALSAAERALARSRLELELELARVAALRGDEQAFLSGLEVAIDVLESEFDLEAPEIEGALALLRELRGFDIDPERPNIAGSLNLLRAQRDEVL
jgi:uncharacterized protein HemX